MSSNLGGDFVIVRGDGTPLYHFTVVVDDAAMEISHVIRGEDHLSNTPKHILLFRALGYPVPLFAHLPLILNPDRTKMSKRKSQTAVSDYIAEGFIREALVNYLALLGWATGTEEEVLVDRRDRRAVRSRRTSTRAARSSIASGSSGSTASGSAGSTPDDLVDRLRPFVEADHAAGRIDRVPSDEELRSLLPVITERLPTLGAIGDLVGFLWVDATSTYDPALLVPKRWDAATTLEGLAAARDGHRRRRGGLVRGRRARAAAPCPGRGPRLEGRRPVHGHPRRGHRPDRDAAAVRHARRARARADPRATRPRHRRS